MAVGVIMVVVEVRGARWKKNIFVRGSQQDREKRGQTLEQKRAKALFVYKNSRTLISTFLELPKGLSLEEPRTPA
jgi:hypothetical protein